MSNSLVRRGALPSYPHIYSHGAPQKFLRAGSIVAGDGESLSPALIDLAATGRTQCRLPLDRHLHHGSVTVSLCSLPATQKIILVSEHVIVGMHTGPPVRLDWGQPSGEVRSRRIRQGMAHVLAANSPVWLYCHEPADVLVVTLNAGFFLSVSVESENAAADIRTMVGIADWKIRRLARLFERELVEEGGDGGFYLESLASALAVHLLRHYGQSRHTPGLARGGIAPARLRRVLEYMDEHLAENIPLTSLAALSGLAFHHFAHAFKDSMGVSPHRFLIERRITRARSLLADPSLSVAEIALMLGFADQSHFTEYFRRLTGITPARYRRKL